MFSSWSSAVVTYEKLFILYGHQKGRQDEWKQVGNQNQWNCGENHELGILKKYWNQVAYQNLSHADNSVLQVGPLIHSFSYAYLQSLQTSNLGQHSLGNWRTILFISAFLLYAVINSPCPCPCPCPSPWTYFQAWWCLLFSTHPKNSPRNNRRKSKWETYLIFKLNMKQKEMQTNINTVVQEKLCVFTIHCNPSLPSL